MKYKIRQYCIYSSGLRTDRHGRPLQEDYVYPSAGAASPDDNLFVVCDGMGDGGAGLQASSTVCLALAEFIGKRYADGIFSKGDMLRAIDAAHDALDAVGHNSHLSMGTTLAALRLTDQGYICAHMGDSRIYHFRPGRSGADTRILFRTEDHTLANHLLKKGEISDSEARTSPKRHVITRAMQPNMSHRCTPDVHAGSDVRPGDYFMLCTDGMLEHLTDQNLLDIFSDDGGNAKNKAATLNKATLNNDDNHSAIIVLIADVVDDAHASAPQPHAPAAPEVSAPGRYARRDAPRNYDNQYDPMDNTASHQRQQRRNSKVSEFVANADVGPLVIKFLFILMGLLILIMLIYYLFIRSNESLQTAGTAVDEPLNDDTELYGYEITEEDVRNEARPVAPDEIEPIIEDDEVIIGNDDTDISPDDATIPQEHHNNEHILLE